MMNNNVAVMGISAGDEAKGRCVHTFSKDFDYTVRTSGSNNCGHTIYINDKKFVYNSIPSIDFESNAKGFLSSGMVINLDALITEIEKFNKDFNNVGTRLTVDPEAFVVLEKHIEQDKAENQNIGTTFKGVGPAYRDKISRTGTRVSDFIKSNAPSIVRLKELGVTFKYNLELREEFMQKKLLFEGAQGALLSINTGIYPYVSCGDCTVSGISAAGFHYAMPDKVYGVGKVYTTKVGEGPFPTEYQGEEAETLRKLGNEYGAVTGRPRRVGAMDLPAMRYAIATSGINALIITKFDILNGRDTIKVCNRYTKEPVSSADFFDAKPEYVELPGWKNGSSIGPFIKYIEQETNLTVDYVSMGVNPEDFIKV